MGSGCTRPLSSENGQIQTSRKHGETDNQMNGHSKLNKSNDSLSIFEGDVMQLPSHTLPSLATKSTLHHFPELASRYIDVIRGNLLMTFPTKAKVVRIFTSSTFTDTAVERNALMEKVYPKLKLFAKEQGFEFQVVDMRWGVRDSSSDDHTTLELCLKELKACQQLSTGPNFVTFLGQKYGFRPIPSKIHSAEYEKIFNAVQEESDKELLQTWFKCDFNAVPPNFVLQPISSQIPNYLDQDLEERGRAISQWQEIFDRIQEILRRAAVKALHEEHEVYKYFMSVTESEVRQGILESSDAAAQCYWIRRNIRDLKEHANDKRARDFIDVSPNSQEIDQSAQNMLLKLKEEIVLRNLPEANIKTYEVGWSNSDQAGGDAHAQYIEQLCEEFEGLMKERISQAMRVRNETDVSDPLYEETLQHLSFCQSKCGTFFGREEILKRCHDYLASDSSHPLVIHGASGCGKTSVVSVVAERARNWLGVEQSNLIIRYIGTTPDSSQARLLLRSVCKQICVLYEKDPSYVRQDLKELKEDFVNCLSLATAEEPLLIFLDSLDQLSPDDGGRQLAWLPMTLPTHAKLIVSTLPDRMFECFPVLQALLPSESFIEVPKLPESDAEHIMLTWLKIEGRTLSNSQQSIISEALQTCSLPLFVRVAFDEAVRWKSFTAPCETVLQHTVRGAIDALFERVERQHGRLLVRRALGYVTAAKSGLTETELEDVLSCDDDVLDDVYQYWIPPIRRIPPLLWVRIRGDLSSYLVDRGADGARVVTWYHRQFVEAARARYLSSQNDRMFIHQALAEFFLGTWAEGRAKPYAEETGSEKSANRFVAPQPLVFESKGTRTNFNHRKLNELPFHLVLANQLDLLKTEVLCNFRFLLTNLHASSLRDVMDDYDFALHWYREDEDIRTVKETLQLSSFALMTHPEQLSAQLLGRIKLSPDSHFITQLLSQAREPTVPCLIPGDVCLTSPGGPLVHSLSGQTQPSTALVTSPDGLLAVSACADNTCNIWDVSRGRLARSLEGSGQEVRWAVVTEDNATLVTSGFGCISAWQISTGQKLFSLTEHKSTAPICLMKREGETHLASLLKGTLVLYNLKTVEVACEFPDRRLMAYKESSSSFFIAATEKEILYSGYDSDRPESGWVHSVDVETGDFNDKLRLDQNETIQFIGIAANGALLLVSSETKTSGQFRRAGNASQAAYFRLQLLDVSKECLTSKLTDFSDEVHCYALSADQSKAATLGRSRFRNSDSLFQGEIQIFDLATLEVQKCFLRYPSNISFIAYVDYNHVITASRDKLVRVWDLERNRSNLFDEQQEKEILGVYKHRILYAEGSAMNVVDLDTGDKWRFVNDVLAHLCPVDNNRVVVVSANNMFLFDLATRKMVLKFNGKTHGGMLWRSCFVYDTTKLIALSQDQRSLQVYDVTTGEVVKKLTAGQSDPISRFVTSEDGRFCVCGHKTVKQDKSEPSHTYVVWNMHTMKVSQRVCARQNSTADFYEMKLTNDGSFLLDVDFDRSSSLYRAVVYDLNTGQPLHSSRTSAHVQTASISIEKNCFLLGLFDGSLELYDLNSGLRLHYVTAHAGAIHCIQKTSNGKIAMTTAGPLDSKDRSIRLWSVGAKLALLTVFTPDAKISSMVLADDGQLVALEITEIVPFWLHRGAQLGENCTRERQAAREGFVTTVNLKDEKLSVVVSGGKYNS